MSTGWGSGSWGIAAWGASDFPCAIADTAQGVDALSASIGWRSSLSDTGRGSDTTSVLGSLNLQVSDTARGSDTMQATSAFVSAVAETVRGAGAASSVVNFRSAISDTARSNDQPVATVGFSSAVSDAVTGDSISVIGALVFITMPEQARGQDATASLLTVPTSVSDASVASDGADSVVNFATAFAASSSIVYLPPIAAVNFSADVTDVATLLLELSAKYLWDPTDDNQAANWQNTDDSQTPAWASVAAAGTGNWQTVGSGTVNP